MQLSREGIQRMIEGSGAGSGSGGGIGANDLIGYATEVWVNKNFLSIEFFSKLFKAYNGNTEVTPNDTETTITNIKAMFGFWTEQYISALGQNSSGGGGGATALTELVDVDISNPTNGQVLKYNSSTHKWYNGTDEGITSLAWSQITNKPTTISGYGITDAYISNGTIHIGSNSITPLTSFIESDPTVPAWAKAASKPSYNFNEIGGSLTFSQLPTMYWADVAVSNSSNNNTSPQFGNLRLRPGSASYGSYLRFGDGDYSYIAELSDDHLTYRSDSHTFNVSSSEKVQINSDGLRIGGSTGVVLSWDSTNNALKVQKADGTAANFYATGGVSALGLSAGTSVSSMTFNYLKVNNELRLKTDSALIYGDTNDNIYIESAGLYVSSNLIMGGYNIETGGGHIFLGGGRLYLDSSRYLYVSGGTLYYYNGSTSKTIAFTN